MVEMPRRSMEELMFIYDQDSKRKDIYVEGEYDKSVLKWFVEEINMSFIKIYTIDTVEISEEELEERKMQHNNRNRIIYMASVMNKRNIMYIVDADYDYLRKNIDYTENVQITDYSCMEMYFYSERILGKFITLYCQRYEWPIKTIMKTISKILAKKFIFRMANEELKWFMSTPSKMNCVKIEEWDIIFNEEEYIDKILINNGKKQYKEEYKQKCSELEALLQKDMRYQINGHDWIKVLTWYLRKKGVKSEILKEEVIERNILLITEKSEVINEKLFKNIIKLGVA